MVGYRTVDKKDLYGYNNNKGDSKIEKQSPL